MSPTEASLCRPCDVKLFFGNQLWVILNRNKIYFSFIKRKVRHTLLLFPSPFKISWTITMVYSTGKFEPHLEVVSFDKSQQLTSTTKLLKMIFLWFQVILVQIISIERIGTYICAWGFGSDFFLFLLTPAAKAFILAHTGSCKSHGPSLKQKNTISEHNQTLENENN